MHGIGMHGRKTGTRRADTDLSHPHWRLKNRRGKDRSPEWYMFHRGVWPVRLERDQGSDESHQCLLLPTCP